MKVFILVAVVVVLSLVVGVDVVRAQTPTPTPTAYYMACAEDITETVMLDPDWVSVCAECLIPPTPTPFIEMTPFPTYALTGTITATATITPTMTPVPTNTPVPSPTATPHLYYKAYNQSFTITNGNCNSPTNQLIGLSDTIRGEIRGVVIHWTASGNLGNLGLKDLSGTFNGGSSGARDRSQGTCLYVGSSSNCNSANVADEDFAFSPWIPYTWKAYNTGDPVNLGIFAQANCNNGTLSWSGVVDGLVYYGIPLVPTPTVTPTPTITPTPEPYYVDCMHPVYIPDDPFADFNPPEYNGTVCYGIIPRVQIELLDLGDFTQDIDIPEVEFCFEKYTFPSLQLADIYIPLELLLLPAVMFIVALIMQW